MKKFVFLPLFFILFAVACGEKTVTVQMHEVTADGVGKAIGFIKAHDSAKGLVLNVDVSGIPAGEHGFHVHVNPSCDATGPDGKKGAALAAGGHYDPSATNTHLGPKGAGHKGDLPVLTANNDAVIKAEVLAPHITLADIRNRSLMIHAGGDNYSDTPTTLGGGGARIACGVVN